MATYSTDGNYIRLEVGQLREQLNLREAVNLLNVQDSKLRDFERARKEKTRIDENDARIMREGKVTDEAREYMLEVVSCGEHLGEDGMCDCARTHLGQLAAIAKAFEPVAYWYQEEGEPPNLPAAIAAATYDLEGDRAETLMIRGKLCNAGFWAQHPNWGPEDVVSHLLAELAVMDMKRVAKGN